MDRGLDQARPVPPSVDAVEAALAKALEGATVAMRFDVVAQLAKELEARRLARMGMRAGELEALTWDDVDFEHGVIQINKAIDRASRYRNHLDGCAWR